MKDGVYICKGVYKGCTGVVKSIQGDMMTVFINIVYKDCIGKGLELNNAAVSVDDVV